MAGRRVLLLSAGMGGGHDAAAAEIARRLTDRGDTVRTLDVFDCLPAGLGAAIQGFYAGMLRYAPWLYEFIWHHVVDTPPGTTVSPDPVEVLALRPVRRLVADLRPDAVVPVFHVAAQIAGRLRADGSLRAPVTVVVTELVVHRGWIHEANDRHLCVHSSAAAEAAGHGGRDAIAAAPLVGRAYAGPPPDSGLPQGVDSAVADRTPVLIAAGAWGAGSVTETARIVAGSVRYAAVVLCGHNEELVRHLARMDGVVPLGWRDDVPRLLAGSAAVIQNGGGLSCWEALALGRPVVTYAPLPGHGRAAAERLANVGLAPWPRTPAALLADLDRARTARSGPRLELAALPDPAQLILP